MVMVVVMVTFSVNHDQNPNLGINSNPPNHIVETRR